MPLNPNPSFRPPALNTCPPKQSGGRSTGRTSRGLLQTVLWVLLLGLLPLANGQAQPAPTPGEGLYAPDRVSLPPPIDEAIQGVVRASPTVRFQLTLFAHADSAAAARSAPGARAKIPTDRGTLWPVLVDTSTTSSLCSSPLTAAQTGIHELCQTLRHSPCEQYPCSRVTAPLAGSATGFFVGRRPDGSALVATNYHVAREAIERHNRTGGVDSFRTASIEPDLSIAVSQDGSHSSDSYAVTSGGALLSNASQAEWQAGEDWALAEIPASEVPPSARMLPLRDEPPTVGDTLYALGFPIRTIRDLPDDAPYENAANDLRVSVGIVVEGDSAARAKSEPSDLLSTLDAVSGNSGSPVLNRQGHVVGIVRHHTHTNGEIDLNVGSYGGLTQIVPIRFLRTPIQRARAHD